MKEFVKYTSQTQFYLINQKPKTKEIIHHDVFGNLIENSSLLHP